MKSLLTFKKRKTFPPRDNRRARPTLDCLEARVNPAPIQFFYVPLPEQQTLAALEAIGSGSQGNDVTSFITITATQNGTVISYDHWEDGYEANLASPLQATTEIWGDGNPANGTRTGPTDLINAGTVLSLRNDIPANPRDPASIFFDGRDKIGSSETIAMSRAQFPVTGGSVISSAVEVRDTRYFGLSYTAPVGTNTPSAGETFEYTSFFVMAAQNNTTVRIDRDNDGTFEQTVVLNQGQNVTSPADVLQGGRVVADKPVQVNLLTGDIDSSFASRSYALFADNQLANDYFTPVGEASNDFRAALYVYNPNGVAITVNFETQTTSGSLGVIPAGGAARFEVPADTGTRLFSAGGQPFAVVGVADDDGVTFDWGFSLQPVSSLSQIAQVGLGVGNSDGPPPTDNTSPVWVTPLAATRVYVDWDGDPTTGPLVDPQGNRYDEHFDLARLQSQRVLDTADNDNSGMRLYTLDGTLISTAWGEDASTAPEGSPGFDAGTTIPAVPVPEFYKFSDFAPGGDVNGDGVFNSGDRVRYTLRIRNISTQPIANVVVTDMLPPEVTYLSNTTFIDQGGGPLSISDFGATAFPLDESGFTIVNLAAGSTTFITFDVTINSGLPAGITEAINRALLSYQFFEIPASNTLPLGATVGDRVWYDLDGDGVQDAGEPGIQGAVLTLTWFGPDGVSGGGDDQTFLTSTGANGIYTINSLPAGNYAVAVTGLPAGLTTQTAGVSTFSLAPGEVRSDIDFGYQGGSTLAGFVYRDLSVDGVRQPGGANPETGIAGVTVTLTGTDILGNSITRTTVTAADGSYFFGGLLAGNYTLTETQPPSVFVAGPNGFYDGLDTIGTVGGVPAGTSQGKNQFTVTLGTGQSGAGYNFGENPPADPFGFVYIDANNNGRRAPGEPGIRGVSVTISGTAFAGTPLARPLTAADVPGGRLTVLTDARGRWEFPVLPPGIYTVVEAQPAGFADGREQDGDPNGPPAVVGNDRFDRVVLSPSPVRGPFNFGELAANASLSGSVYVDRNNNGVRDRGETGLPGVTVVLSGRDVLGRSLRASVVTDGNGNYSFRKLFPGTYHLSEVQPTALLDGRERAGSLGGRVGNDAITRIVVGPNRVGTGYQFGERGLRPEMITKRYFLASTAATGAAGSGVSFVNPAADPSGYVYVDRNRNGRRDRNERGIAGVQIVLTGRSASGQRVVRTQYTDINGFYRFDFLPAGTYTLTQVQPRGYRDGRESRGSLGGVVGNDRFSRIILRAGQVGTGYNFGELLASAVVCPDTPAEDNTAAEVADEEGTARPLPEGPEASDQGEAVELVDRVFASWADGPVIPPAGSYLAALAWACLPWWREPVKPARRASHG